MRTETCMFWPIARASLLRRVPELLQALSTYLKTNEII